MNNQLIDSYIENLKFNKDLITFTFTTHITYIEDPGNLGYEFNKRKRPKPLTEDVQDYVKQQILTPVNVANELRIALLNYVPSLGIHKVNIIKNTSFLTDDLLETRIILASIKLEDPKLIWEMYETKSCKCEEGDKCYFCDVTGTIDVTAYEDNLDLLTDFINFSDDRVQAIPRIGIMKLAKGHTIVANIGVNKGFGEDSTIYRPVNIIGFKIRIPNKGSEAESVDFKVELNQKLPPLFVLYFALSYIKKKFKTFTYQIEGGYLGKDEDENIVFTKE